jgi:hypothetical protein
MTLHWSIAK